MADPLAILALATSGIAAWAALRNSNSAKDKVNQEAFRDAKDYYSGALDDMRKDLDLQKQLRREIKAELDEAIAARERAEDKNELLGIRVATLEKEMRLAETKIYSLERLLRDNNVELPPEE